MASAAPLLSIDGLVAGYGDIRALHGVSIDVAEGATTVVLGANGAGKTTLLRAVSGLVAARAGDIRLRGKSIKGRDPEKIVAMGVTQVPQGRMVFAPLTVAENLRMGGFLGGRGAVAAGLERAVGYFPILGERMNQVAGTLSGGEQQMLAIARALMLKPALLMLDEPSMGVAPLVKEQIFETLEDIRAREGLTMLLVEQDAELALDLADRAYVLETGRIVMEGTGAAIAADEALRRAYLGV